MRKKIKVLIICSFMLILCGCGKKEPFAHEKATYVSSNDSNVRIELTEEHHQVGEMKSDMYIAYLYDGNEVYEGYYGIMDDSSLFKKSSVLAVTFIGEPVNENEYDAIHGFFRVKGNKLKAEGLNDQIFLDNAEFVKKAWTKQIVIVIVVILVIIFLKTIITNKESRKEFIEETKEAFK